ncbi:AAA family ATPase [Flavimarina sp. Hel_I_48]|uniref:AAA family ATPase n=1 Tax=Flavimarina sp. Hel_I_48 TaxID=1392488 RepID=UPI0004DF88E3|nr:AAA family ATPase [Flavimarina sp. Hel_I_48]
MLIDSLELKNGHTIELRSLNLVIGPNNSGKSSFLKDLQNLTDQGLILGSTNPSGLTEEQIKIFMEKANNFSVPAPKGGSWNSGSWEEAQTHVKREIKSVSNTLLKRKWTQTTMILDGKTRLAMVDDKAYQGISSKEKQNVFETLRRNRKLKAELQKHMEVILPGKYFALWNPKPAVLRAYICNIEPINDIEYFDSPDAATFFEENAIPLSSYSDGIKAYLGILINVIADGKLQFLIDEPEAFLHPNLCFKLGQTLSTISLGKDNMCFCATHSPYFLKGCLSLTPNEVSVTRFEFEKEISKANTLATEDLKAVIHDPLLNNIGVTEGLFHSRVVVTEGDSDRAFYNEINNRLVAFTDKGIRDCLFVNAQNKQTIAKVLGLFRKVSIPCAAISDIDTFKEGGTNFTNILNSLSIIGGSAESLSVLRERVNQSLKAAANSTGIEETTFEILSERLSNANSEGKSVSEFLGSLRGITKPPDYKRLGGASLLSGSEISDANNLITQLASAGWFVIPNGEVEKWLLSLGVGTSKHGWLLRIFEKMGSDPMLPEYVNPPNPLDDVWLFTSKINEWFLNQTNLKEHKTT